MPKYRILKIVDIYKHYELPYWKIQRRVLGSFWITEEICFSEFNAKRYLEEFENRHKIKTIKQVL